MPLSNGKQARTKEKEPNNKKPEISHGTHSGHRQGCHIFGAQRERMHDHSILCSAKQQQSQAGWTQGTHKPRALWNPIDQMVHQKKEAGMRKPG